MRYNNSENCFVKYNNKLINFVKYTTELLTWGEVLGGIWVSVRSRGAIFLFCEVFGQFSLYFLRMYEDLGLEGKKINDQPSKCVDSAMNAGECKEDSLHSPTVWIFECEVIGHHRWSRLDNRPGITIIVLGAGGAREGSERARCSIGGSWMTQ